MFYILLANGRHKYRGAGKSLARTGRKQARKHVRDAHDINNIETRAVIKFHSFLQGKAPKEIHVILTGILGCFLPGRAKDLSAPLHVNRNHIAFSPQRETFFGCNLRPFLGSVIKH